MEPKPTDSWRAWLLTGGRVSLADKRRVRGSHRGLKKVLIEGLSEQAQADRPWTEFSGAMVRQSVNEALSKLPHEEMEMVKLAYFSGLTNKEIADRLGVSQGGVQRRLRRAIARISDYLEQGRSFGRRAVYGILAWLGLRQFWTAAQRLPSLGGEHLAAAIVVVTATTALGAQPVASPASTPPSRPASHRSHAVAPPASQAQAGAAAVSAKADLPPVRLPVRLPVKLPVAVPTPPKIKLPTLP